jgi:hypothetical protein
MRHHLLHHFNRQPGRAGVAAIVALAASAWIVPAMAQPAPPPGASPLAQTEGGPGPRGPMGGPMGGPGMHHPMGGEEHHHGWHHGPRGPFSGLIFHREDKQLTAAEVQKIAEGFLLWQGERSWKVTDVHEAANNAVEFSFTTQNGGVIARFSMDRKTGRVQRIG